VWQFALGPRLRFIFGRLSSSQSANLSSLFSSDMLGCSRVLFAFEDVGKNAVTGIIAMRFCATHRRCFGWWVNVFLYSNRWCMVVWDFVYGVVCWGRLLILMTLCGRMLPVVSNARRDACAISGHAYKIYVFGCLLQKLGMVFVVR
jgi:hypothetical protein